MSFINFTGYSKLKSLIEKDHKLYASKNRLPNWINNKNIDKYNKSKSSFFFSSAYKLEIIDEEKRKEKSIIFKFLENHLSMAFKNIFPIYNRSGDELIAIIRDCSIYTNLYAGYITVSEAVSAFIDLFPYMNERNYKLQVDYVEASIVLYTVNQSLILQHFLLGLVLSDYNILKVEECFDIDPTRQEENLLRYLKYLLREKYPECFLELPEFLLDRLRTITDSEENSEKMEPLGFDTIKEAFLQAFEKFTEHYSDNIIIKDYSSIEALCEDDIQKVSSIGRSYRCKGVNNLFIFDESLSDEDKKSYLEKVRSLTSLNCTYLIPNPVQVIVFDMQELKIVGYLYPERWQQVSDIFYGDSEEKMINSITDIYNLLESIKHDIDLSKINLSDFVTVKDFQAYQRVSFNIRVINDSVLKSKLDIHEDIFLNDDSIAQDNLILNLIFSFIKYESEVHSTKFIKIMPPAYRTCYEMYVQNQGNLDITSEEASNLVEGLKVVLGRFSNGKYYDDYIWSPFEVEPYFLKSSKQVDVSGYQFYEEAAPQIEKIISNINAIKRFVECPSVDYIVYKEKGISEFEAVGILSKESDKKENYLSLGKELTQDKFFGGNFGLLLVYAQICRIQSKTGYDYRGDVPTNLSFYVDEEEKIKFIVPYFCAKVEKLEKVLTRIEEQVTKNLERLEDYIPECGYDFYLDRIWHKDYSAIEQKVPVRSKSDYCEIHDLWYKKSDNACPVCLKENLYVKDEEELSKKIKEFGNNSEGKQFGFIIFDNKFGINQDLIRKSISTLAKEGIIARVYKYIRFTTDDLSKVNGYVFEITKQIGSLALFSNKERLKIVLALKKWFKKLNTLGYYKIENPDKLFENIYISKKKSGSFSITLKNPNLLVYSENDSVQEDNNILVDTIAEIIKYDYADDSLRQAKKLNLISNGRLSKKISNLSKYCSLHNYYFKEKDTCKYCANDQVNCRNIYIGDIEVMEENDEFRNGGEARVYEDPENERLVVKIWKDDKIILKQKYEVIKALTSKDIKSVPYDSYKVKIVTPIMFAKVMEDETDGQIGGYYMEKVENAKPVRLLEDKNIVNEFELDISDILEILINFGMGLEYIHSKGAYIGDLSGNNILFDREKWVYILDVDSFGIDEFKSLTYTSNYADPLAIISESDVRTSKISDYYAFAIVAFLSLTRQHPFKGIYYVDGRKVTMSTEDRMKNKISVLGNHEIKLPKHIENDGGWSWMSEKLKEAFLGIFENEARFNIVDNLIEELNLINGHFSKAKVSNKPSDRNGMQEIKEGGNLTTRSEKKKFANSYNPKVAVQDYSGEFDGYMHLSCKLKYPLNSKESFKAKIMYSEGETGTVMRFYKNDSPLTKSFTHCTDNEILEFDASLSEKIVVFACKGVRGDIALEETDYFKTKVETLSCNYMALVNILYDEMTKRFLIFNGNDCTYLTSKENGIEELERVDERILNSIPSEAFEIKNYLFFNNSLYFPLDGRILAKNVLTGSEKNFLVPGLKQAEVKWLVRTVQGFKAFSINTDSAKKVFEITG